jgi:hypothetical protein
MAIAIFTTKAAPIGRSVEILGESVLAAGVHHMMAEGFAAYKHQQLKKKIDQYYKENPNAPYPPPFLMNEVFMRHGMRPAFQPIHNNNMKYAESSIQNNQEKSQDITPGTEEQIKKQESSIQNNQEKSKEQIKGQESSIKSPSSTQNIKSQTNEFTDITL